MDKPKIFLILLFISSLYIAKGQDRIFTYTYQSNVLNLGEREIEIWNSIESGREDFYQRFRHRVEYELGLGGNLQTAFYLNMSQKSYFDVDIEDIVNESAKIGFSNEWKWKISDPVANFIGFGLYGEFTIEPNEIEIEGKLLFDKQTGDFLHAANIIVERGWEKEVEAGTVVSEAFTEGILLYALAYRLKPGLHFGFESMIKTEWAPVREYSNLFAGPFFSFARNKFWINGTFLPQISSLYSVDEASNGLDLNHSSKFEARVIFSFML